jgi:homoserine kinase type II
MAVYTRVARADLETFVAAFDVGEIVSFEGIAQGIENSNYLLCTTADKFVLTLYEKRVRTADLPFFLGLMTWLSEAGFPCPHPVPDRTGEVLHTLSGRPAALVSFAAGDWPRKMTPDNCHAVGIAAAQLHKIAAEFPMSRGNDHSLPAWRKIYTPLIRNADRLKPGFSGWIDAELTSLEANWPTGLPSGVIHGDLFPDNVFFEDSKVSGVIDFYFACTDAFAFDLAICLNAWCFDDAGALDNSHASALIDGYESVRKLTSPEQEALPILARGAGMRFLVTRLHDWFHTPEDTLTRRKDPLQFVPLIEFHRSVCHSGKAGMASYKVSG